MADSFEPVTGYDAVHVLDANGSGGGLYVYDWIWVSVSELGEAMDAGMINALEPELRYVLDGMVAQLRSEDPTIRIVEPLATITVGSLNGYSVMISETFPDGAKVSTCTLMLFEGTKEYDLILQSTAQGLKDNREIFDNLVESFRIGAR